MAAVANYHRFGALKHHKFNLFQFWLPEISNGLAGLVPSGGSREKSVSLHFSAPICCRHFLAPGPFIHHSNSYFHHASTTADFDPPALLSGGPL